jgi:amidohydrolase
MTLPPIDRAQLIADRRDLHQHPELAFEEHRTAGLVAERMRGLGYAVSTGVGGTGVVATRAGGDRCVLLRADMDALPVEEASDVPYRSRHAGRMHACGHDGHVAMGLEVARRLAAVQLPGTVKFAFQPAEEMNNGAAAMIDAGVLRGPRVDAAFGVHLWNYLPLGTIGVMPGPVMAAVDLFEITVVGRGGHASAPHLTVDPVLVAAHIVTALQSVVSRSRDPLEEGVVSVTEVGAGAAYNVIPVRAVLRGTVRSFGGRFFAEVPGLVERTARGVAAALGAGVELRYERLSRPVVNDDAMTAVMRAAAEAVVGRDHVRQGVRTMGGEDFACFLEAVPGCFAFVGSAPRDGRPGAPHHSPTFDIEEEALAIGADLLTRTAVGYLTRG